MTYLDNRLATARAYLAGCSRESLLLAIENSDEGDPAETLLLLDDNARLRALIKDAERASGYQSYHSVTCPWCDSETQHSAECHAFDPDGTVK